MKGNQGLEALAALCGGRPKAIDSKVGGNAPADVTSNASGSGATPSSPRRTSPHTAVSSNLAVKSPSAATSATTNQLLMRQAAERNAANGSSGGNGSAPTQQQQQQQQQQQHPVATATAPMSADAMVAPGPTALGNLTPQQISQAIMAAANAQGGRLDLALAQPLLYPSNGVEATATPVPSVCNSNNNILANTMQQLVIQQYLQAQANMQQQQVQQQQQAQAAATAAATSGHPQAALLAMTLAAGKAGQSQQHFLPTTAPAPMAATVTTTTTGAHDHQRSNQQQQQQAQAQAQAKVLLQHAAQHQQQQQQQQQLNTGGFTSIKPASTGIHQHAQTIQQQYHFQNGTPATNTAVTNSNMPSMIKIAAAGGRILPSTELSPPNSSSNPRTSSATKESANSSVDEQPVGSHKKQQKRAANRRSAQLSRKRKKQFIEELKEENDDLRRKEQILRAIPDLIVVFDSSGKLGFVSESVGRFLDMCPDELEGTSFWLLICEESVRMLKAAFMDSLAAREADSDTALLGSGVWELRLKDKNNKYMFVTLNGVVHFKGDAPECVCCIRPLGEEHQQQKQLSQEQQQTQPSASNQQSKTNGLENGTDAKRGDRANKNSNRAVSCSDGDASRTSDGSNGTQQSVLTSRHGGVSMSSAEQDEAANDAKKRNKKFRRSSDNQNSNNNNNDNLEADGTNNSVRVSDGDSNDGIESD